MIKENTKYSYEELKGLFEKAEAKAMMIMENNIEEARKESGKGENPMGRVAFTLQNMMAMHTLIMVLLGKEI